MPFSSNVCCALLFLSVYFRPLSTHIKESNAFQTPIYSLQEKNPMHFKPLSTHVRESNAFQTLFTHIKESNAFVKSLASASNCHK